MILHDIRYIHITNYNVLRSTTLMSIFLKIEENYLSGVNVLKYWEIPVIKITYFYLIIYYLKNAYLIVQFFF